MRRAKALAAVVALLLAAGLAACGDGGSDETSMATGAAATTETDRQPPSSGNGQSGGSGSDGQELARGGEASIEDFGSEAGGSDREAILTVFETYLNAIGAKDYDTACSNLSTTVQRSLGQFVAPAQRAAGCAATLPKLLAPSAAPVAREQANGEIAKVRVEDDNAFVIFRAPGAELYQLTMIEEDGEWKAATVIAAVLVPQL